MSHRWQPLTGDAEFDTESFKSGKSDDKDRDTLVYGWIRYLDGGPKYKSIMLNVVGHCDARRLSYISGVPVKVDGSEESQSHGGVLEIRPGNSYEDVLKALCKRVKPWWKPF